MGDFTAVVVWAGTDDQSVVTASVTATDRYALLERTPNAPEATCSDLLEIEVAVDLTADDQRIVGKAVGFTAIEPAEPLSHTRVRISDQKATLRGTLELDHGSHGEPQAILLYFDLVRFDGDGRPPRMSLELVAAYEGDAAAGGDGWTTVIAYAGPPDGCGVDAVPSGERLATEHACTPVRNLEDD